MADTLVADQDCLTVATPGATSTLRSHAICHAGSGTRHAVLRMLDSEIGEDFLYGFKGGPEGPPRAAGPGPGLPARRRHLRRLRCRRFQPAGRRET